MVAHQKWSQAVVPPNQQVDPRIKRANCLDCNAASYWVDEQMVWPVPRAAVEPNPELPDDLAVIFDEARVVMPHSPRAAAGLLRLLIDLLTKQLSEDTGGPGKAKLYDRIDVLRDGGHITEPTKQALHALRLGGNNAVHEGVILLEGDDRDTVLDMFRLVNAVVAQALEEPQIAARLADSAKRS